jgi:hypothetical protein
MQQARDSQAEQTGEVMQNHEVGTGLLVWLARGRRRGGDIVPGVDALEHVDGGAMRSDDAWGAAMLHDADTPGESQERRSVSDRGEAAKL